MMLEYVNIVDIVVVFINMFAKPNMLRFLGLHVVAVKRCFLCFRVGSLRSGHTQAWWVLCPLFRTWLFQDPLTCTNVSKINA